MTLRDPDIRAPLLALLEQRGELTVDEFEVDKGSARVDIASITDSDLIGYEIKSDVDTNARLRRQAHSYDKVFTKLCLVTTPKKLASMVDIIQPWWGILIAHETARGVVFEEKLDPRPNPTWISISALQLLWHTEFDKLMAEKRLPLRQSAVRAVRAKRIASSLPEDEVRRLWLHYLRARYIQQPELRVAGRSKPRV